MTYLLLWAFENGLVEATVWDVFQDAFMLTCAGLALFMLAYLVYHLFPLE